MPANWFGRESHSLLIAYLRHCSNAKLIAAEIELFAPAWLGEMTVSTAIEQLIKIADREHRAMALWPQNANFAILATAASSRCEGNRQFADH